MANEKKLVIFDNWIQPAAYLSKEDQQEYYGLLCMHLMYGNVKAEDGSNKSIQMLLEMILPLVDLAKKNYEIRSAAGKMGGRPKKVTDELVWRYVQTNPAAKSADVAQALGLSKSAVDHSLGWKYRKDKNFL